MITVHNLDNSRSFRMIWLLEELGLAFDIKQYTRRADNSLAPDDYRKLHPLGKAPVVTDGDQVLVESGAIVETLLDRYGQGRLQPEPGSREWVDYRYWMHASEGSLMPLLVLKLVLNRMESGAPFFIRPLIKVVTGKVNAMYVNPSLSKFLGFMNNALTESSWL
ncbi:MAG: glutathione S-transferase [Acidobacteriota bacterium]|nr:glutathione S-transferase [Acidobacteriota bacterium]